MYHGPSAPKHKDTELFTKYYIAFLVEFEVGRQSWGKDSSASSAGFAM